jgi:FimV-like protein
MDQALTLNKGEAIRLAIEQAEQATSQLVEAGLVDLRDDPTQRLKLLSAFAATHVRNFGRRGVLSTEDLEKIAVDEVRRRHTPEVVIEVEAASLAASESTAADVSPVSLEPLALAEVGTKLDLARAYMDMGDPENAAHVLEEVLKEEEAVKDQFAELARGFEKQRG